MVSIITPNWNCASYVAQTIKSVQEQTYRNWEMIIVDDCSTDKSVNIIESFAVSDARIRLLKNSRNSGAAISRNYALREAKGRWISFLDSDDRWMADKLEKQLRFMVDGGYGFSFTEYKEIDDESKETGVIISGPRKVSKSGMYAFCWPGCLTVMYDREKIGLVQIEDIKKNNDYAMWLKVCCKASCHMLREPLALYRRGRTGSISIHSYSTMIRWHYKLWHEAEGRNPLVAFFLTCVNLVCGLFKKIRYVRRYEL